MGQEENKMEIRKSELNHNENTPNQNLQNTAQMVLTGKLQP